MAVNFLYWQAKWVQAKRYTGKRGEKKGEVSFFSTSAAGATPTFCGVTL